MGLDECGVGSALNRSFPPRRLPIPIPPFLQGCDGVLTKLFSVILVASVVTLSIDSKVGELVYQTYYTEPTVNLRLRKGWNHLLIKIENQGDDWGFLARCADADGTPITDLDLFPQPTPLTVTRGTFERTLAIGLNFISLPLRPDTPFTAQSMINRMGVSGDGDHAGTVR